MYPCHRIPFPCFRMNELSPIRLQLWQCPVCHFTSSDYEEVKKCICQEDEYKPTAKVGDILYSQYPSYGWKDGDELWVHHRSKTETGFEDNKLMSFFYVVTHIDRWEGREHEPRYHLVTCAMSGKQGHRGGYIGDLNSYTIAKKIPNKVQKDAKKLIGFICEHMK